MFKFKISIGRNKMRNHTKNKLMLLILGFIFGFSILIYSNLIHYQGKSSGNLENDNEPELKRAGYWDLTGSPIHIDDNDPALNWAITAATNEWCSGSGSWNDPYLIENVTIDGQSSGLLVRIYNLEVYFIIRNNTLFNGHTGIYLEHVENGLLINNTVSYCSSQGIHLVVGQNITISENIVEYNFRGLTFSSSNNNIIRKNSVSFNGDSFGDYYTAIIITDSDGNIIKENEVFNNVNGGIFTEGDSNNNEILGNNFYNNEYGLQLSGNGYNQILENNMTNNDYGIYLGSSLNSVSKNYVVNNNLYGIYIPNSQNYISLNNFSKNSINGYDDGTNNQWDYNSFGNYWDDYGGVDVNDDGIGDTAYDVPPAGGSMDNYPIWDDGDDLAPDIIINSPSMNDAFGLTAPDFDITINDASQINATWYTIDSGITNYTFFGLTGTVNQTGWDNKGTESMTLRFYANDSLGHLGFKDVAIWKDLVAPQITINSPTPNQLCGVDAPSFSLTIDEPNIQVKQYSINGRPNITFTTETQFNQSEWNTAGNGTVSITFYVIDKVGNTNSSEVIVRKDAYIPDIVILSPIQDEIFGSTPPEFNISIIEEDLMSMWYIIEGNLTQYPFTGIIGTISQEAWDHTIEGDVTITFYAQDRAGNIGIESVMVIKSIPSQPSIPGYNLFVLLGVLSVAIIIIGRKWRNLRG